MPPQAGCWPLPGHPYDNIMASPLPTILNDNDSAMSTKSLNETVKFKFAFALPQHQRGQLMYMKHLYKSFVSLFLRYKH